MDTLYHLFIHWRWRDIYDLKDYCLKGHFIAGIDTQTCTSCGSCLEKCQWGAIYHSPTADLTAIDPIRCFGCGLCRVSCGNHAITMVLRAELPMARNLW